MSCAAPEGGAALPASAGKETIIQGQVVRAGAGVRSYVRLLGRTGDFTAEVPTGDDGRFRFFAAPGEWTLRTLAPRIDPHDVVVVAGQGQVTDVSVELPA